MNPHPEDDARLVDFLKQHRPVVPAATPDLEERIMAATIDKPSVIDASSPGRWQRRTRWWLPLAIATGFIAIAVYQSFLRPQPSEAELAELETFIESTWEGTVAEQPMTETEVVYPLVNEADAN